MKISVCIIAKNEESFIGNCINSIKDIAYEIIVVDTGSTDRTKEICRELGAKVFNFEWEGDFSKARNFSLEKAEGDWIFVLDADETLTRESIEVIEKLQNEEEKLDGYYCKLTNLIKNKQVSSSRILRLFRNYEKYRYRGKLHEQIDITEESKAKFTNSNIEIYHYGYDPDIKSIEKKSFRNISILDTYEEGLRDGYYYYVLGNEYARNEDNKKALEIYDISLKKAKLGRNKALYTNFLMLNILKILWREKKSGAILKYIRIYEKDFNDLKDIYFFKYLAFNEQGKYTKALKALNEYKTVKNGSGEYPENNFENFHNLENIEAYLKENSIPHNDKLLSVYIEVSMRDITNLRPLKDTIISINEIANEVIVFCNSEYMDKITELLGYGCKLRAVSKKHNKQGSRIMFKSLLGQYVLMLKGGEIIQNHYKKILVNRLVYERKNAYYVYIYEYGKKEPVKDMRIFKRKCDNRTLEKNKCENLEEMDIKIYNSTRYIKLT